MLAGEPYARERVIITQASGNRVGQSVLLHPPTRTPSRARPKMQVEPSPHFTPSPPPPLTPSRTICCQVGEADCGVCLHHTPPPTTSLRPLPPLTPPRSICCQVGKADCGVGLHHTPPPTTPLPHHPHWRLHVPSVARLVRQTAALACTRGRASVSSVTSGSIPPLSTTSLEWNETSARDTVKGKPTSTVATGSTREQIAAYLQFVLLAVVMFASASDAASRTSGLSLFSKPISGWMPSVTKQPEGEH